VTDVAGNRIGQLKHAVDARLALTMRPSQRLYVTVGASGLNSRVFRAFVIPSGVFGLERKIADESQFSQAAGEVTVGLTPVRGVALRLQCEYLHQFGPGMRDADYLLAGARFTWKGLAAYINNSYVRYDLGPSVQEYIIQPGVSYAIGGGLAALVEYDEWQRKDPRGVTLWTAATTTGYYPVDRSLNVVLVYSY
jgi:hypothetical protein